MPTYFSPAANFEVSSTGTCSVNLVSDSDNNGSANDAFIAFHTNSNSGTAKAAIKYDESQTNFGIETHGTRALSIDSSQNVGIGTTSPNAKLEISGNSGGRGLRLLDGENLDISAGASANDPARIATSSGSGIQFAVNGTSGENMRIDSSGRLLVGRTSSTGSGEDIQDSKGGIRAIPQNSKTAAYTLVVGDAGKHINITTGGVTVPSGVFSTGDAVTIYNDSSSDQTVTQGSSVTLRSAGTADTGNRTLAQRGICTLLCVASNEFVISGAGLS